MIREIKFANMYSWFLIIIGGLGFLFGIYADVSDRIIPSVLGIEKSFSNVEFILAAYLILLTRFVLKSSNIIDEIEEKLNDRVIK